jgi:hypothetical protein
MFTAQRMQCASPAASDQPASSLVHAVSAGHSDEKRSSMHSSSSSSFSDTRMPGTQRSTSMQR